MAMLAASKFQDTGQRHLTRIRHTLTQTKESASIIEPTVIPRPEHCISRSNISPGALKVLYALKNADFAAYLVGGGVRDLLIGVEPKDFDVVTDATPEQVRELFRRCRLIGRRFRLAHVRFGPEVIEVATLRGTAQDNADEDDGATDRVSVNGRIVRDNVYGNALEEDVWRRDFTINSLYYDIRDFSVVDYAGGVADLESRTLRLIGDPSVRYREDPVRILRAIRFAKKLGFDFHPDSLAAIPECAHLLEEIPPARLFDEVLKLFLNGCAREVFQALLEHDVFKYLFPQTAACIGESSEGLAQGFATRMVVQALANTDERLRDDKPVTPAFLFAALLWEPVRRLAATMAQTEGVGRIQALENAGMEVFSLQSKHVSLPRRFSMGAREIWSLQPRLEGRKGKRALGLLENPRFRAAYDFLLLRAQAGEDPTLEKHADWWTQAQAGDESTVEHLGSEGAKSRDNRGRRPRRRSRGRAASRASPGDPSAPNQSGSQSGSQSGATSGNASGGSSGRSTR